MNYNINIPSNADYIIISPQHYYLNAEIENNTISITLDCKDMSRYRNNCLSFPLPCCDIDVKNIAEKFAFRLDCLLGCNAIEFDGEKITINDPIYVLDVITELNFYF